MKKFFKFSVLFFMLGLTAQSVLARHAKLPMDRVMYQASAEKWVKTDDAKVVVSVNAALKDADLATMRKNLMNKLSQISPSDWHITQFDRRVDNTGLESVTVSAQARIKEDKLTGLRSRAKNVSSPGETYRIDQIDFEPSFAARQAVENDLRADIYQKINDELARLKKAYPQQNFSVYRVNFLPMSAYAGNRARKMMSMAMVQQAQPAAPLSVSQKITLNAVVVLAANRSMPGAGQ